MKNKQLIVNAALGVAVLILFILQFSGGSSAVEAPTTETPDASTEEVATADTTEVKEVEEDISLDTLLKELVVEEGTERSSTTLPVAYVNLDEVQKDFVYFTKKAGNLEKSFKAKEKALVNEEAEIKGKMQDYYIQYQNGQIEEADMKAFQMAIEPQIQRLQEKAVQVDQDFQKALFELTQDANNKIRKFLEDNRTRLKYDLVIGMSQRGNVILYGDEELDITDHMIKGLNKAYK